MKDVIIGWFKNVEKVGHTYEEKEIIFRKNIPASIKKLEKIGIMLTDDDDMKRIVVCI